jgi:hypothetical protein
MAGIYNVQVFAPSTNETARDFTVETLVAYNIELDAFFGTLRSLDGEAKTIVSTQRITEYSGSLFYRTTISESTYLPADGTAITLSGWIGTPRGLRVTSISTTSAQPSSTPYAVALLDMPNKTVYEADVYAETSVTASSASNSVVTYVKLGLTTGASSVADATLGTDTTSFDYAYQRYFNTEAQLDYILQFYNEYTSTWVNYNPGMAVLVPKNNQGNFYGYGGTLKVRAKIFADTLVEPNEEFRISAQLSNQSGNSVGTGPGEIAYSTITIRGEPTLTVPTSLTVEENITQYSIMATKPFNAEAVYVKFQLRNDTNPNTVDAVIGPLDGMFIDVSNSNIEYMTANASSWSPYTQGTAVLFPAFEPYIAFRVTFPYYDVLPEPSEVFLTAITTTDVTGVTNRISYVTTVTIQDNDPVPNYQVSVNNVTVNEASPYAIFTVTGTIGQAVTLRLGLQDTRWANRYLNQIEYYYKNMWVAFIYQVQMPQSGQLLVRVPILNNNIYDGTQERIFYLQAVIGGTVTASGDCYIRDDGTGDIYTFNNVSGVPEYGIPLDNDIEVITTTLDIKETYGHAIFLVRKPETSLQNIYAKFTTTTDLDPATEDAFLGVDTYNPANSIYPLQYWNPNNNSWVQYVPGTVLEIGVPGIAFRTGISTDTEIENPEVLLLKITTTNNTGTVEFRDFYSRVNIIDADAEGVKLQFKGPTQNFYFPALGGAFGIIVDGNRLLNLDGNAKILSIAGTNAKNPIKNITRTIRIPPNGYYEFEFSLFVISLFKITSVIIDNTFNDLYSKQLLISGITGNIGILAYYNATEAFVNPKNNLDTVYFHTQLSYVKILQELSINLTLPNITQFVSSSNEYATTNILTSTVIGVSNIPNPVLFFEVDGVLVPGTHRIQNAGTSARYCFVSIDSNSQVIINLLNLAYGSSLPSVTKFIKVYLAEAT